MLRQGEFGPLFVDFASRVYRGLYGVVYSFAQPRHLARASGQNAPVQLKTDHPIAYESPDHIVPWGTQNDNSTNKKFVLHMAGVVDRTGAPQPRGFLDLGCSGGQLVKDFKDLGWVAVGLEGSDYSLKHQRANWPALAGKSLFTCDITKPFELTVSGQAAQFDLITAWEVLEHIHPNDLDALFGNLRRYLRRGGYFIASTASTSDMHDGVELHQCRLSNAEWKALVKQRYADLEEASVGLRMYHYVRFNYRDPSFLVYRKR